MYQLVTAASLATPNILRDFTNFNTDLTAAPTKFVCLTIQSTTMQHFKYHVHMGRVVYITSECFFV